MEYLLIFLAELIFLFFISRVLIKTISLFLLKVTRNRGLAIRLFHFLFLPGVIIHELAHLIVAEVMLVRTGGLSFSLEQDEDKMVLGSVGIEETDPVRRSIIGFAPVLIGIALIAFSVFYFLSDQSILSFPWNYILVFFIVFEIGNTMFSSRRDLEGTIQLLFAAALLVIAAYFLGFKLPGWVVNFLNSSQFVNVIQKGIRILLFPIAVDLVIVLITRTSNASKSSEGLRKFFF